MTVTDNGLGARGTLQWIVTVEVALLYHAPMTIQASSSSLPINLRLHRLLEIVLGTRDGLVLLLIHALPLQALRAKVEEVKSRYSQALGGVIANHELLLLLRLVSLFLLVSTCLRSLVISI